MEQQFGSALPSLNGTERAQVLVQIDRSANDNAPLLSSLLAAGGPHFAFQYFRRVPASLGLDAPNDDDDLWDVVAADADKVFADWRFR
ncbi:hypothetical protein [Streptomyces sp. NPDC002526]